MAHELYRKRLNCMNAWIKYYDDGSEILQSYNTNVVKKTPDGKYIRLWDGNTATTSKQVHVWCNESFRKLPYADGTYEDLTRPYVYKRTSYGLRKQTYPAIALVGEKRKCRYNPKDTGQLERIAVSILNKDINNIIRCYETGMDIELKKIYKDQPNFLCLFEALSVCSTRMLSKKPCDIEVLAKLYNYDFVKVWQQSLQTLFPEYKLNIEYIY